MYNKKDLIDFEKKVYDLFESGDLPYLIHLCGGNEDNLIEIFKEIKKDDWVFSSHRTHYHFLLKGGSDVDLLEKIKQGDSMFVFSRLLNFFSSSILSGCTGIACGVAMANKLQNLNSKVFCFIGDGAEDEGHFYEAVRFSDANDLNILFIIEDNNRSVDTSKEQRGSNTCFLKSEKIIRYHYTPTYPHASTGSGKLVKFKQEKINQYINKSENI
jgi:pyruvate dehydrogenase E1 component alpha subunit